MMGGGNTLGTTHEFHCVFHLLNRFQKQFHSNINLIANGMIMINIALIDVVIDDLLISNLDSVFERLSFPVHVSTMNAGSQDSEYLTRHGGI